MREIRLPNSNGGNFEAEISQSGNPQMALDCWRPKEQAERLEQQDVFCAAQQESDNRPRLLAPHIRDFCRLFHETANLVDGNLIPLRPNEFTEEIRAALAQIIQLVRQMPVADRRQLFDHAIDFANQSGASRGRRFALTINPAPAPNQTTWIIQGTFTQRRDGVDRTVDIRIEIPPPAPAGGGGGGA